MMQLGLLMSAPLDEMMVHRKVKGRVSGFGACICAWKKKTTHIYFSNRILYLAQAERRMTKIPRKYQRIAPTLSTLNLVLTRRFYATVDASLAICTLVSRVAGGETCKIAVKSSNTKFSQANFTPAQSTRFRLVLLPAYLLYRAKAKEKYLIHAHALNRETLPLIPALCCIHWYTWEERQCGVDFLVWRNNTGVETRGPFLEGPEMFSGPESHNKNLKPYVYNFNTNKVNFHAKFNAYTLLSFWGAYH